MARVLLIGQDRSRAAGIRSILRDGGHRVHLCRSTERWSDFEHDVRPELVVAPMDSIEDVLASRNRGRRAFPAPVLWVDDAVGGRVPFRRDRLVDRIGSPFMSEELLGRVDGLVRVWQVMHRQATATFAAETGQGRRLARYPEVAVRLADWADRRDAFEPGHSERVASFCEMIADALSLPPDETGVLLKAAMLHDIGKIGIPVQLLHQKSPLQEEQTRLIRTHPRKGAALARALEPDGRVANTILYHHERPDGGGYYGRWSEVPVTARALAVSEVLDAMVHSQVGATMPETAAIEKLREMRGVSLDADCVNALTSKLKPRTRSIPLSH